MTLFWVSILIEAVACFVFLVVIILGWRAHNRTVMSEPSATDEEVEALLHPERPVLPRPTRRWET